MMLSGNQPDPCPISSPEIFGLGRMIFQKKFLGRYRAIEKLALENDFNSLVIKNSFKVIRNKETLIYSGMATKYNFFGN